MLAFAGATKTPFPPKRKKSRTFGDWLKVPRCWIFDPELTPAALKLLLVMRALASSENLRCFASQKTLARLVGLSESQVRRLQKDLLRKGYLLPMGRERVQNGKRRKTQTYKICLPEETSSCPDDRASMLGDPCDDRAWMTGHDRAWMTGHPVTEKQLPNGTKPSKNGGVSRVSNLLEGGGNKYQDSGFKKNGEQKFCAEDFERSRLALHAEHSVFADKFCKESKSSAPRAATSVFADEFGNEESLRISSSLQANAGRCGNCARVAWLTDGLCLACRLLTDGWAKRASWLNGSTFDGVVVHCGNCGEPQAPTQLLLRRHAGETAFTFRCHSCRGKVFTLPER